MAVYKVPQDVEAEDKLIGPFSFRQFIYLLIVAMAGGIAWGLSQLFLPLAIIPLPIIIFFGALALPLRKDQPMEIYLAAIASFFLKPHLRKWDPDGIESLIEITVPKIVEIQRTKDISQGEAQRRLGYLAEVVDTQGWAVRGTGAQAPNSALNTDVYNDAQQAEDILGDDARISQLLNQRMEQNDIARRQEIADMVKAKIESSVDYFKEGGSELAQQTANNTPQDLEYNPYPKEIQQSVLQPIIEPEQPPQPTTATSEKAPSADIINLANSDLSIATIASQANRINEKQDMNKEVFVSLR